MMTPAKGLGGGTNAPPPGLPGGVSAPQAKPGIRSNPVERTDADDPRLNYMVTVTPVRGRTPRLAWFNAVSAADMSEHPGARKFGLDILTNLIGSDGILRTGGIDHLIDLWREHGIRGSACKRLILDMLQVLKDMGFLTVFRKSAPGRPAEYRITAPAKLVSWVVARARGVIGKRHATYMKELGEAEMAKMDWDRARRSERGRGEEEFIWNAAAMNPTMMQAKFPGGCKLCDIRYGAGAWIVKHPRGWVHQECFNNELRQTA